MDTEVVRVAKPGHLDEYDSAFEYDSEYERAKANRRDLTVKGIRKTEGKAQKHVFTDEYSRNEAIPQRYHRSGLDAYGRHKQLINDYLLYYKGAAALLRRDTSRDRTDLDIIRENHRFLWPDEDAEGATWGQRMAKKYYDKLFKEYCIADLSRYNENKIAMRWRIEKEVVDGKGQFMCGNKICSEQDDLHSWEVNFGYSEGGEKRNALVKLRLCPDCSFKLNYSHKRKEVKKNKRRRRRRKSEGSVDNTPPAKSSKTGEGSILAPEKPEDTMEKDSEEVEAELESKIWKAPVKMDEKSREEEFDEYLEDLFL